MTLLYIIVGIIGVCVILALVVPVKIIINFDMENQNIDKSNFKKSKEKLKTINKVDIYVLRVIKVKTIYINKDEKTNKNVLSNIFKILSNYISYEKKDSFILSKKEIIKLKKGLKFEEFNLNLGFNLKEPILNAYIISLLNSFINIYIAKNINHFNLEKTKYQTYISGKIIDLKFYSIINFKLVNNIIIIFKLVFKLRKGGNINGKTASNRKFDDDCYDLT